MGRLSPPTFYSPGSPKGQGSSTSWGGKRTTSTGGYTSWKGGATGKGVGRKFGRKAARKGGGT